MLLLGCALAATVWTGAGVQALAGVRLDEFLLQERVGALASSLPGGMGRSFPGAEYLRRGSFGEAWRATREVGGERGTVILKLFFRKLSDGRVIYLTKANLRPEERRAAAQATQECALAQQIVNFSPRGDVGKHRVVNCLEDRASDRGPDEPLYLVLEDGGQSVKDWLAGAGRRAPARERRKVVGQLLQGVRTMGELLPSPLVHHDLKPANCVYDGTVARLIDFGGTVQGTVAQQHKPAVATPGYAPPEFLGLVPGDRKVSFHLPGHSFDVFAVGLIYAEVMCPDVPFGRLVAFARAGARRNDLQRLFATAGCLVSDLDLSPMLAMLAYRASERPAPSRLLLGEPFADLAELEADVSVAASAEDPGPLVQSLLDPRNQDPVRVFHFDDKSAWQQAAQCAWLPEDPQHNPLMATADFASLDFTRAQCEKKCVEVEAQHGAAMRNILGEAATTFCCQLDVYTDGSGPGRQCRWGRGELAPFAGRAGTAYARLLPLSAPEPLPRVLHVHSDTTPYGGRYELSHRRLHGAPMWTNAGGVPGVAEAHIFRTNGQGWMVGFDIEHERGWLSLVSASPVPPAHGWGSWSAAKRAWEPAPSTWVSAQALPAELEVRVGQTRWARLALAAALHRNAPTWSGVGGGQQHHVFLTAQRKWMVGNDLDAETGYFLSKDQWPDGAPPVWPAGEGVHGLVWQKFARDAWEEAEEVQVRVYEADPGDERRVVPMVETLEDSVESGEEQRHEWRVDHQCEFVPAPNPLMETADFDATGTRLQCEQKCIQLAQAYRAELQHKIGGAGEFCCQVHLFQRPLAGLGKSCSWGHGRLVPDGHRSPDQAAVSTPTRVPRDVRYALLVALDAPGVNLARLEAAHSQPGAAAPLRVPNPDHAPPVLGLSSHEFSDVDGDYLLGPERHNGRPVWSHNYAAQTAYLYMHLAARASRAPKGQWVVGPELGGDAHWLRASEVTATTAWPDRCSWLRGSDGKKVPRTRFYADTELPEPDQNSLLDAGSPESVVVNAAAPEPEAAQARVVRAVSANGQQMAANQGRRTLRTERGFVVAATRRESAVPGGG